MDGPSCPCGLRCQLFGGGSSRLCCLCMRDLSRAGMHWGCPCGAFVAGMECPCAPDGAEPRVMRRKMSMESLPPVEEVDDDVDDVDVDVADVNKVPDEESIGAETIKFMLGDGNGDVAISTFDTFSDGSGGELACETVTVFGVDAAGRSARLGELGAATLCEALPQDRPRSSAAARSAYRALKDLLTDTFLDEEQGAAERVMRDNRHGKQKEWLHPCAVKVHPGMVLTVEIAGSVGRCRVRSAL